MSRLVQTLETVNFAKELVLDAGRMLIKVPIQERFAATKIEPTLDKRIERILIPKITQRFPEHDILAEEEYNEDPSWSDFLGYTWVLDLLDGTDNYGNGFDFCAVSLALKKEEQTILGIVYNPFTKNFMWASEFATNPKIIQHTQDFPYIDINDSKISVILEAAFRDQQGILSNLRKYSKEIVARGCTSLECTQVGFKQIDAVVKKVTGHIWGYSAGAYISKKLGADVTDEHGDEINHRSNFVIISNPYLHSDIIDVLQDAKKSRSYSSTLTFQDTAATVPYPLNTFYLNDAPTTEPAPPTEPIYQRNTPEYKEEPETEEESKTQEQPDHEKATIQLANLPSEINPASPTQIIEPSDETYNDETCREPMHSLGTIKSDKPSTYPTATFEKDCRTFETKNRELILSTYFNILAEEIFGLRGFKIINTADTRIIFEHLGDRSTLFECVNEEREEPTIQTHLRNCLEEASRIHLLEPTNIPTTARFKINEGIERFNKLKRNTQIPKLLDRLAGEILLSTQPIFYTDCFLRNFIYSTEQKAKKIDYNKAGNYLGFFDLGHIIESVSDDTISRKNKIELLEEYKLSIKAHAATISCYIERGNRNPSEVLNPLIYRLGRRNNGPLTQLVYRSNNIPDYLEHFLDIKQELIYGTDLDVFEGILQFLCQFNENNLTQALEHPNFTEQYCVSGIIRCLSSYAAFEEFKNSTRSFNEKQLWKLNQSIQIENAISLIDILNETTDFYESSSKTQKATSTIRKELMEIYSQENLKTVREKHKLDTLLNRFSLNDINLTLYTEYGDPIYKGNLQELLTKRQETRLLIGRNTDNCFSGYLKDLSVSREHVTIFMSGQGTLFVQDGYSKKSSNGSVINIHEGSQHIVNDFKLSGNKPLRLIDITSSEETTCTVKIGNYTLEIAKN